MQELLNQSVPDEDIVAAVQIGNADRYRELVERHQRRVFGVAWSRLGNVDLAEEAAQEAFILGFRRLSTLTDKSKFGAWIGSIARHVSINLGLRRRRELNKRERWALDQAVIQEEGGGEEEPCSLKTLRQALEKLPAVHRECLVLAYMEGKSGAEAAVALGVSEAAFRVRLHRARAVLRAEMDKTLEHSLAKLRPSKSVVPMVMAAVLAANSAKAATGGAVLGAGGTLYSVLGKSVLFSWFISFISLVGALPGLLVSYVVVRMEQKNFRDPEGFRARSHRRYFRTFFIGFPLLLLMVMFGTRWVSVVWGTGALLPSLTVFCGILTVLGARSWWMFRTRPIGNSFLYCLVITLGLVFEAFGWISSHVRILSMIAFTAFHTRSMAKYRPVAMDFSLFLRASQNLLPPQQKSNPRSSTEEELRCFARFLCKHWLVGNFSWRKNGLALRLPPVRTSFLRMIVGIFSLPVSRSSSHIILQWDGNVTAHCSRADLSVLNEDRSPNVPVAEDRYLSQVSNAVSSAWDSFRRGDVSAAVSALGEVSEEDVYLVPPARSKGMRLWQNSIMALLLFGVLGLGIVFFLNPAYFSREKPVTATEVEVRAFLDSIPPADSDEQALGFSFALFDCLVVPSTNLFSEEALQRMRDDVLPMREWNGATPELDPSTLQHNWGLQRAFLDGWVDSEDLAMVGLRREPLQRYFRKVAAEIVSEGRLFNPRESWSWVLEERMTANRLGQYGLNQLRLLQKVNVIEFIDRKNLVSQIASRQILSGDTLPGQPRIHHWRNVRGLFHTPNWPTLPDTYYSVVALEILGGLDAIDREACIKAVLRRHRGGGFFDSPSPGSYNEYKISGNAQDTFCAFEILRILGALDRVDDLEKWQFRTRKDSKTNRLTWNEVEAWTCQQRLAERLKSKGRIRSLQEP